MNSSNVDALVSVIAYFRITKARAREIFSEVLKSVESWHTTGQIIGMSAEELEPFVGAFEHTDRTRKEAHLKIRIDQRSADSA